MPQYLALLICISLILYLFWIDRKNNEGFSSAIWIPFFWLFFSQTRNVAQWLSLGPPNLSSASEAMVAGNPLNSVIYQILMISGLIVLLKREIDWRAIFKNNGAIWLYFIFGALSFFWSDYPFVSAKRWIKVLGVIVMVLIVVTETRPYMAIGVIIKRLSFVLLPLSVLFIRYFPELGRAYHMGLPMYTGVCSTKNSLGVLCLIVGIYYSWNLILGRRDKNQTGQKLDFFIYAIILPITAWLFYMANSATSLVCLIAALCIFLIARLPVFINSPQKIMVFGIAGIIIFIAMDWALNLQDTIIAMLGRRPDLTDRVYLWEKYLSLVIHPIIGYGYEIFYTTVLMQNKIREYIPAHNGYLEMYLHLGVIGVLFVVGWIVSGLFKVWNYLVFDYTTAIFRLALIVVVVLYSWTEVVFSGTNTLWMLLFIAVFSVPRAEDKVNNGI